jgi:hypothetical protein
MNMVALVDGQPRLLNLKQMLECFLRIAAKSSPGAPFRTAQGARARRTSRKVWRWRSTTSMRSLR